MIILRHETLVTIAVLRMRVIGALLTIALMSIALEMVTLLMIVAKMITRLCRAMEMRQGVILSIVLIVMLHKKILDFQVMGVLSLVATTTQ